MANQSTSNPILCASFNQDASCFVIAVGAFTIVEMLFTSSLLAIVGAGEQPSLSPRRLCLFNTMTGTALRELNFLTSILAVRMNKKRLVVVLQEKTYVYDINSLAILDTIDTVPNVKGLCAFSPDLDACFVALPASTTRGSVLLYNAMDLHSHCEIDAHRSLLAAMTLSSNGMYIATASEQGTIIRVHLVSEATKSYSFRRGTYPSTIFSLSFGPSMELPDILVATSSSGSVHAFSLGFALCQRGRRSSIILGSIIPESVSDALDPAHHDVFHNAAPAGVKSHAVVRRVDRVTDSSTSQIVACRATISMVTYNGYFQEYNLTISNRDKYSWSLEREFNLLTVIPENAI
ncbi:Guanine nucleotide-binding protein, beta subunit [Parasponia andersonii]|uniref:Guanine nucleotide-binding protein, beta subunit n=1 Tax=Parasponia andersonii TaxID=3476 RepID=A0A2P5BI54_PARAD|nr:Guanine nucleotide-binding protein, beta subunit [Parasponia andersonii]